MILPCKHLEPTFDYLLYYIYIHTTQHLDGYLASVFYLPF